MQRRRKWFGIVLLGFAVMVLDGYGSRTEQEKDNSSFAVQKVQQLHFQGV